MIVSKDFTFDAAHVLPHVPEGHKCRNLHGHTYRVRLFVKGPVNEIGWVVDFADIKAAWKPVEKMLDHQYLNDVEGLENPTAEYIAIWIWDKMKPRLPNLYKIELFETPSNCVIYSGE